RRPPPGAQRHAARRRVRPRLRPPAAGRRRDGAGAGRAGGRPAGAPAVPRRRRPPALGPGGRQRRRPRPSAHRPRPRPPPPARLRREVDLYGDPALAALLDEVCGYPGVVATPADEDVASRLFVPLELRSEAGPLRFFSTIATFGTARDVTVEELSIESFFPAD